jgi:integrase
MRQPVKRRLTLGGTIMARKSAKPHTFKTDLQVKALRGDPAGPYDVKDAHSRGVRVRVMPTGQRTFVLLARFGGKTSNPTRRALGHYPVLSLEEAREKANQWRKLLKRNIDPKVEEERKRAAEALKQQTSFLAVAEEFIADKLANQRKGREAARDLRKVFIQEAGWANRPITEITPLDVRNAIKPYKDAGKIHHAHNLLSYVRRVFNWAIDQQIYAGLETSPCDRLKPSSIIGEKTQRSRVLNDAELQATWRATDKLGYAYGPLFKMLMLTGQRKSEVAEARWREIDLAKKLWTIPAERMKADAAHIVPLSDDAIAVLKSLPRFNGGDYLFSAHVGARPVAAFSAAKHRLDAAIADELGREIPPFVIHDLRRTVRTGLSAIPNISDLVRELVIGHTKPGLHKVYDQYAYLEEKRFALDAWAARLRGIVNPKADNVVELARAGAQL